MLRARTHALAHTSTNRPKQWKPQDLPDLVKDGVYFTIEKVRGFQTGRAGYEEIQHKEEL